MTFEDNFARVADMTTERMRDQQVPVLDPALSDPKVMKKRLQQAEKLIPRSIWQKLRKAFTPKGLAFFRFYIDMNRIRLGGPVEGNLKTAYKRAADRLAQVRSPFDGRPLSPSAVNQVASLIKVSTKVS